MADLLLPLINNCRLRPIDSYSTVRNAIPASFCWTSHMLLLIPISQDIHMHLYYIHHPIIMQSEMLPSPKNCKENKIILISESISVRMIKNTLLTYYNRDLIVHFIAFSFALSANQPVISLKNNQGIPDLQRRKHAPWQTPLDWKEKSISGAGSYMLSRQESEQVFDFSRTKEGKIVFVDSAYKIRKGINERWQASLKRKTELSVTQLAIGLKN